MAAKFFADLGNTVGAFIPYKCPHCKTTRKISEYGGNLFDGAICPNCNNDPIPQKVGRFCTFYAVATIRGELVLQHIANI